MYLSTVGGYRGDWVLGGEEGVREEEGKRE